MFSLRSFLSSELKKSLDTLNPKASRFKSVAENSQVWFIMPVSGQRLDITRLSSGWAFFSKFSQIPRLFRKLIEGSKSAVDLPSLSELFSFIPPVLFSIQTTEKPKDNKPFAVNRPDIPPPQTNTSEVIIFNSVSFTKKDEQKTRSFGELSLTLYR